MSDARSRSKCPRVPWALCDTFGAIRESVPALHCTWKSVQNRGQNAGGSIKGEAQWDKCSRRHWANQINQRGLWLEPSCKTLGWMQHLWHTQATLCSSAVWGGCLTASPQRYGLYRVKEHDLKRWLSGPVPTAMHCMQHLNLLITTLLC